METRRRRPQRARRRGALDVGRRPRRPRRRAGAPPTVPQQSPDEILDAAAQIDPVIEVDRARARAFVARLFEAAPSSDPNDPLWDLWSEARDLFGGLD